MSLDPRRSISVSAENINRSGFRLSGYGARGEKMWKTIKSGKEYTTSTYGILKILIMGFALAAFVCLLITAGRNLHNARYTSFLASTALTFLVNLFIFCMCRFKVWDVRKPSLPHQVERLNGFVFVIWNFVSSGLIAPNPQKHVAIANSMEPIECHAPQEICNGRTTMASILGFVLSLCILVNFFLAVWWGPPLRYSMRLKNLTEGDKYTNFTSASLEEVDEEHHFASNM